MQLHRSAKFLIFIWLVLTSSISFGAPGDLDTSFGTSGVVIYNNGDQDYGWGVVLQDDGQIIVAGYSDSISSVDIVILRYTTNGSLDTGFGTNGVAIYDGGYSDRAFAVTLQDDGRIIVAGWSYNGSDYDLVVLRFTSNGLLDTSFGTSGVAIYDNGDDDRGYGVALQDDGRIIVAGFSDNGTDNDFVVLRYNTDGSLDTGFGTNGVAIYDSGNDDLGFTVTLQDDGRIVAVGRSDDGSDNDLVVVRYTSNGSLDTGFGSSGVATYDNGDDDRGYGVALQDDGRIIVSGRSHNGSDNDLVVLRFTSSGFLDTSFGANGVATYDNGNDESAWPVALQDDGRIIVAGCSHNSTDSDIVILRYTSIGSLDTGFGTNGVATYENRNHDNQYNESYDVALQNDGRIIITGRFWSDTDFNIGTIRFLGGGDSGSGGDSGGCFITLVL